MDNWTPKRWGHPQNSMVSASISKWGEKGLFTYHHRPFSSGFCRNDSCAGDEFGGWESGLDPRGMSCHPVPSPWPHWNHLYFLTTLPLSSDPWPSSLALGCTLIGVWGPMQAGKFDWSPLQFPFKVQVGREQALDHIITSQSPGEDI